MTASISSAVRPRTMAILCWLLAVVGVGLCIGLGVKLAGWKAPDVAVPKVPEVMPMEATGAAGRNIESGELDAVASNPLLGPRPARKAPPPATIDAVVISTIVTRKSASAIVSTPAGQKYVRVGDELIGGTITTIRRESVTVDRIGESIELPVQASGRAAPPIQPLRSASSRSLQRFRPGFLSMDFRRFFRRR